MSDTVDALVRLRAENDPAIPTVIDPTDRIDYAELDAVTHRLAAAFVDHGVGNGNRVGLIMPNAVDGVRIAVALTRIGAVLVPLSTLLQPRELVAQLRVASVQHLVAVDEFRGHWYHDELCAELQIAGLGDEDLRHPGLPALRRGLDARGAARRRCGFRRCRRGRRDDRRRDATRSAGGHVHLGQQRHAHGRGALPRQRAACGAVQPRFTVYRRTHPAVPADAVFFWVGGFGSGLLSASATDS
jgi:hypothetical protein